MISGLSILDAPKLAGALAVGGIVGALAGFVWGHAAAGASAERRALRDRVAVMEREQKTALDIQTRMAEAASRLRVSNEELRNKANDLEASFQSRPIPACRYTDDDLRRLRELANGTIGRRTNPPARQRIAPPLRLPGAVN